MGFESKVPPLPTRDQEIIAIERLEQSWLNQSYNKYYMNEDLRRPKMQFAARQNKVRAEFWTNFLIFGVLSIPLAFMARRLVIRRTANIPTTYPIYEYTWKERSSFETRTKSYNLISSAIWLANTSFWSFIMTDWQPIEDQNYTFVAKVKTML